MKNIDAKGKACPIPVIMAKKEADSGTTDFSVSVDNQTAVGNLSRFGTNGGFTVKVDEISDQEFLVSFSKAVSLESGLAKEANLPDEAKSPDGAIAQDPVSLPDGANLPSLTGGKKTWAVFIGKKGIGEGDEEFSQTLMNMYLYTLSESDDIPQYILFMNQGVSIPTENEEATDHIKKLIEKGTKVLVCGACLNFYGLEAELKAGEVSNMYNISEAMVEVDKVISL